MNFPEPYFACAIANPATVPGTPTASPESRDFSGSASPFALRNIVGRGRGWRGLAIVDGGVAVALGEVDHHEAAAADIAGARIGDGERKADRDGRIDRVAAAVENLDADAGGAPLLRHHHAVARKDGLRRRDRFGRACRRCDLRVGGAKRNECKAMKERKEPAHVSMPALPGVRARRSYRAWA